MKLLKKIIVTGAGGFVGQSVIKKLYEEKYNVVGLYRNSSKEEYPWLNIEFDLAKQNLSDVLIKNIDCVVHCAAVIPTDFFNEDVAYVAEINKKIDNNVIDYCTANGIRLIYTSSTSVYGFNASKIAEDTPLNPLGLYSIGKVNSEKQIRENVEKYDILRINAPYGLGQKQNTVLKIFIEKAAAGADITYYGSGKREQDFTHVSDIANLVKCCVNHDSLNGFLNIASGNSISMKALARLVVSLTYGCKSKILPADKLDMQENYRPEFDISKARRLLSWEPKVSLESGITEWINALQ